MVRFLAFVVVLSSCVFNFVMTPYFECQLDGVCEGDVAKSSWSGVYARSLSVTCLVSIVVLWMRYRRAMAAHDRRIEFHDAYSPTAAAERRAHRY